MGKIKYYVREGKSPKGTAIFYGQNASVQPVELDQICEEVSHATTVTKADVLAILTELEHQFINIMRSNKSVRFGILGAFRSTLQSYASRTSSEFTKANIRQIGLRYTPSATMRYKLKFGSPDMTWEKIDPNE